MLLKKWRIFGLITVMAGWGFADDVEKHPTSLDAFIDAGQIKSGKLDSKEDVVPWQVIQRTKISLGQESTVGENLTLRGAMGGLFYYSLPTTSAPHTRIVKFTPVVEEASADYRFGDPEMPFARLKLGVFFFKYNEDSQNLGEYLYRSSVYPNIVRTGGWYFLGSGYLAQGLHLKFNFLEGALSTDFTLFMEREEEPNYDLSPAFLVKYKAGSMFTVQAGVEFSHLIPASPSITSPTNRQVGYFKGLDTLAAVQLDTTGLFDPRIVNTADSLGPIIIVPDGHVFSSSDSLDTAGHTTITAPASYRRMIYNVAEVREDDPAEQFYKDSRLSFYTHQGAKVMGRASFSPFGSGESEMFHPHDLKIYLEFALLGVKDYPIFYDDKWKRLPVMMGINIPTFKLLDILTFEVEYWDHTTPNDQFDLYEATLPVPGVGDIVGRRLYVQYLQGLQDPNDLPGFFIQEQKKWKWSLYAKKQISKGVGFHFQIADDHMRTMDFNNKMTYEPVTQDPGDWWYVARLHFAI